MVFIQIGSVMVLTTSFTTTTGMLSVFTNSTFTGYMELVLVLIGISDSAGRRA